MLGVKYPPVITPSQQRGEGMTKTSKNWAEKRQVGNLYGQPSTRLSSSVASVITPIEIEGVKDKDVPVKLTGTPTER